MRQKDEETIREVVQRDPLAEISYQEKETLWKQRYVNSLQTNSKLQEFLFDFNAFQMFAVSLHNHFSLLSILESSVCHFHNLCLNFYKPCDGMTEKM